MPIALKGQCDSTISLCPRTFDYLIKQDIYAKKYYQESIDLLILNKSYKSQLIIKDSLILDKDKIITYLDAQKKLYDNHVQVIESRLKKEKRKRIFVTSLVSIVGLSTTTYFIIH